MTSSSSPWNGWNLVVAGLINEGVTRVFGLPGDPKHLYDALSQSTHPSTPRVVGVRYETSGAFMAMAHARVSGEMAVCFGCPGPGIANLVPGVLEAYSGCTPMLILGVRASRQTDGMGAFQETDHIGMMRPITKWATTVEVPEKIAWTLRRAAHIARTGKPGPVYVELPADVAFSPITSLEYVSAPAVDPPTANPVAIVQAADLIARAKRPLLIVGGGAYLSGAGSAISALSSMFGIAIQTTPAGRGTVAETHPLFVGLTGLYRTTVPRRIFEEADLIITAGSRMEEFQGGFLPKPANPKIIQIDIDPYELGRNWYPDVAIQADCHAAIAAIHAELLGRGLAPVEPWRSDVIAARENSIANASSEVAAELARDQFPISGKSVVHMINDVFGHNTILVKENGGQDLWAYYWPYYQVLDEACCVAPAEQTAMGYGVIGAMAVKLARPDRYVVNTTGDGAFQMSIHELGTAAQVGAAVTWVVLDDGAFGWVQWIQRRELGGRIVATDFDPTIDIVGVAKACGCSSERLERAGDLRAALERARAANDAGKPHVLVVPIDQSHHHAEFDRFHSLEPASNSATA